MVFLCISAGFAETEDIEIDETETPHREDFWLSSGWETALYSIHGYAHGGSLSMGYGDKTSIGFQIIWIPAPEGIDNLEINVLLRRYFRKTETFKGIFCQLMLGSVIFIAEGESAFQAGSLSAGLTLGWRIPLGKRFYLEPTVRAGFPYFTGAGVSAGLSFKQPGRERKAKESKENDEQPLLPFLPVVDDSEWLLTR